MTIFSTFVYMRCDTRLRYLTVLLLIGLCHAQSTAQELNKDSSIIHLYAEKKKSLSEADNKFILLKTKPGKSLLFRQRCGNEIKRQIAQNWFIIKYKSQLPLDSQYVSALYPSNDNWKESSSFLKLCNNSKANQVYTFIIQTDDKISFEQLIDALDNNLIISKNKPTNSLQIRAYLSFVKDTILKKNHVVFVDAKTSLPKEEMVINDYDNSVNAINLFFSKYPAVKGLGLTASVKENLFDTADIDFKNRFRLTPDVSPVTTTHATTMATLIGGVGNSYQTGKGIAPASLLTSSNFANLLPDSDSSYRSSGISVQNHSYGTSVENFYGADAAAFDQTALDNPHLLYVFSAGNSGNLTDSNSAYRNAPRFANITGSFKQAKNIVTVGSVDSFYQVPLAGSKGPAYDGRIKPELVAYGNDGSSGAAAITSGTALAVQSAYAGQHHDSLPDNALVKGILLNSADDVFTQGPDFYSGYGNVNTYKAVKDILSNNFFGGTSQQNKLDSFTISIPDNIKTAKILLVWNDQPAQANILTALVNDLDLAVKNKRANQLWLPWVLQASPDSQALLSLPERKRDSLNVVEQVTLTKPDKGDYTIYVKGYQLHTNTQPFYVVYELDTANQFQFISPTSEDHFKAGSKSIIRWASTYTNATGRLEYSIDKGSSWRLIHNTVSLSNSYDTSWRVPDTTTTAILKMTVGNDIYISDTFDFSYQPMPQVVINCSDSALISWNTIKGVNRYNVMQLGREYLQDYTTVDDTTVLIKNSSSPYIAIASLLGNNHTGLRSYTFNLTTQGTGCYINNFLADLTDDNQAKLTLVLGTLSGVDSIHFQKLTSNGWQTINTILAPTNLETVYNYSSLTNGNNVFRATIWIHGNRLESNTASLFYYLMTNFLIVPNPVTQGQNTSLLSSNVLTGTLVIYDATGRKLVQQEINNPTNKILSNTLAKGVYFLVIYTDKKQVYKNKLIVR